MNGTAAPVAIQVGEWRATLTTGRLDRGGEARQVEPKVMDLLFLLASRPGEVFSRAEVVAGLWPDVLVGNDSLARSVSRLRKALDDDPRAPQYIETIPKRGYRLIAPVSEPAAPEGTGRTGRRRPIALAGVTAAIALVAVLAVISLFGHSGPDPATDQAARLTSRADDFYFQYQRADNEAARELYERVVSTDPDYAPALAGLANTLTQTVIRWPDAPGVADLPRTTLGEALATGRTATPEARRTLGRARSLAQRAVALAPQDPTALRALGLAAAAQGDFDKARRAYEQAVALDPDAWGALFNLGDLKQIQGDPEGAIVWFERAYAAMGRVYDTQASRVRPWYAETGALIGRRHAEAGHVQAAETWFRQVLSYAPLHPAATVGLAGLLAEAGDAGGARRLCREFIERTGPSPECVAISEVTGSRPR